MLLPIHIAAGGLAIVLGAVALSVKKGGTIHRRSGLLFVYAMLVMGVSASILSLLKGRADGNVVAGVLTAYFVGTALTTVRPASSWTRRINAVALTVAVVLAVGCAGERSEVHQYARPRPERCPVPDGGRDVVHRCHRAGDGGGRRRAHHALRHASRRAAPGAPFVAHVLRAVHRGRIVLLDPRARGDNPSGALHDRADARAADPAAVWRDVLLAVEGPRPPHVASARPTRPRACHHAHKVMSQLLTSSGFENASISSRRRIPSPVSSSRTFARCSRLGNIPKNSIGSRGSPSPKCLHDGGRIARTRVNGSERNGAT